MVSFLSLVLVVIMVVVATVVLPVARYVFRVILS